MRIRDARAEDAGVLSALAIRSKAHWGYDDRFLRDVRSELEVTPEQIGAWTVRVLECCSDGAHTLDEGRDGAAVVGFYALRIDADTVELERLFVDPSELERGYGARLLADAVQVASKQGFRTMRIASDPNAEEFYLRAGAVRVGTVASPLAGRELPLLELKVLTR
jgi:GNAT superfamily N-acetyltransferase